MKLAQTLSALLLAGVISLQAQTEQPVISVHSANETAWLALVQIRSDAGNPDAGAAVAATPEGVAIKDAVLEGTTVTAMEAWIVMAVAKAQGGEPARVEATRALAKTDKTGKGMSAVRAMVKFWDNNMEDWTSEMLEAAPTLAGALAAQPNATPAFRDAVWAVIRDRSAHDNRAFFKNYRSTLPKAEQIAVTQKQKNLVLAIPSRDVASNAWLAEISADLVALQLDQ
jgi:hypothetical protein